MREVAEQGQLFSAARRSKNKILKILKILYHQQG
jgi:hypothetical protein